MSFFSGCDFFIALFVLLVPAALLGLSERIKMVQMAHILVFYLGGIRFNKGTAALSDRLCCFCHIFGEDLSIPSKKIWEK